METVFGRPCVPRERFAFGHAAAGRRACALTCAGVFGTADAGGLDDDVDLHPRVDVQKSWYVPAFGNA